VKMSTLFIVHSKWRNTGSLLYLPISFFSLYRPFYVTGGNIPLDAVLICSESKSTCLNQCVTFDIRLCFIIFNTLRTGDADLRF